MYVFNYTHIEREKEKYGGGERDRERKREGRERERQRYGGVTQRKGVGKSGGVGGPFETFPIYLLFSLGDVGDL